MFGFENHEQAATFYNNLENSKGYKSMTSFWTYLRLEFKAIVTNLGGEMEIHFLYHFIALVNDKYLS